MQCPSCRAETTAGAKFCAECGARLIEQRPAEGERRIVTVLFCDVKGSTTMAEELDPEEWTEIMNGAFAGLIPPISRYEGTVVRLLGDAVLAFFGAPTAHEDDPERAVLAGLDMLQALTTYRERLRRERGITTFDVRIGINTGLAVIGDVGSGQRVEYTAMGDAVNVAARLQAAARPGTIVLGETTYRAVAPLFATSPLGAIELKGRAEAMAAFEVIGRAAARGRRRGFAGAHVPVIGRERELGALVAILDEVRAGHGRIVSVIGEPGIGKSRLIEELRTAWRAYGDAVRVRWSDSVCESYMGSQAYLALRPVLADLATGGDPSPIIAGLIGAGDLSATGLEGEALADAIRAEVTETIRTTAREPTVLAFDDLHWSDVASGELLAELFALADELPVLFLLGSRPDRRSVGWRLKQSAETDFPHRYRETVLAPLRPEDGGALIRSALDPSDLPAALYERVAAKADGNPFFLEEIVRTLIERGVLRRDEDAGVWRAIAGAIDVPLPDSLQALLRARIDRLDESARKTLQSASVIGRTFGYRTLAAVAETHDSLDRDLAALQRSELVTETAKLPEREYTFRHALTQDAAYASILQRRRRELHVKVAEALLAQRGGELRDEDAGVVGAHFAQANDPRAVALLVRAGDHARRLYALEEALAHYDRALAVAKDADTRTLGDLHSGRGRTLELRGDHDAAIATYDALLQVAAERGDREVEGRALTMLASIYSTATARRDVVRAAALLERALAIARERDDQVLLATLQESRFWLTYFSGDTDAALQAGEESVRIDRTLGRTEALAFALNNVQHVYRDLGRFADAEAAGREATDLFRAAGNKSMVADSLSTRSQALVCTGDYDAVVRLTDEARALSEEAKNAWGISYADYIAPFVHAERGEVGRAIAAWRRCLEEGRRGGFVAAEVGSRSMLADLCRNVGALDLAEAHATAALEASRRVFPQWLAWPLAVRALVDLDLGRVDAARAAVDEIASLTHAFLSFPPLRAHLALARGALAIADGGPDAGARSLSEARAGFERQGIVCWHPDIALLEGDALIAAGDAARAAEAYRRARDVALRIGSRRALWRIHSALGEREDAREIVRSLAASLDAVALRTSFEALPLVRALAP